MTDSLTKLRRELVAQSADHLSVSDDYKGGRTVTDLAAHRGSLMAGTYAYALAAVLGQLAKDFGPQAGEEYAEMVDFMLVNGDDDDMNADVAEAQITEIGEAFAELRSLEAGREIARSLKAD